MNASFEPATSALAALMLAGCAVFQPPSVPLGASMAQVQATLGKPADVVTARDGDAVWQYPTGPYGVRTYMVTFGADQRVKAFAQALTGDHFATIRKGMSREEIRLMFGRPSTTVTYSRLVEEVWSYRHLIPAAENRIFNVHFDANSGLVRTTSDERDSNDS